MPALTHRQRRHFQYLRPTHSRKMKKTHHWFILTLALTLAIAACKETPPAPRVVKQYTIDQFYKNTNIGGGFWSPDDAKLLVHSNETGIYNLYEINVSDGKMTQLTRSDKESYFAIGYVQSGDVGKNTSAGILYAADQGGNELSHIYLLRGDSTIDLTPDTTARADFMGWSADKSGFYFTSNTRDPQMMDVYKMSVADWKSTLVYQNNAAYEVTDLAWDEKTIALARLITTSQNELYLLDIATGDMTALHDSTAPGNYQGSGFSRDGKHFYYLTNAGKEFAYLVDYDLATKTRKTIFEAKWDVQYSYLSEQEKYRVVATNTDGKNTLQVLDNKTMKPVEFPEIPDGDVLAVNISDSEKWMRLTVGTSKAPANIYAYNFETKELKKLTNTLNAEINPEDLVTAEVVRFKSFDGQEIPAIYYKPLMATPDSLSPALVMVHGGPGGQSRTGYNALVQYLVNHGYAILAVNNRGSSGYGKSFYKMDDRNHGDKDLKDCIWGKKWLQAQNYIDSTKIGIIGGSYGGFMTMCAMTTTPDEFKVGVNFFGVTNWLRTLRSVPPYWASFKNALYAEMGDPNTADSVRLYNISPLFHADQVKHPIMVLQGANDPRVLQVESDEIVAAVKKNNVVAEYIVFPDEGHGFVKKENEIKGYGEILKFLDTHLR
jgi:dipeptidyl aminopeptidase/acylaminoacyl peptidase